MSAKVISLVLVLGVVGAGFGFYAAKNSGSGGALARYGAVLSKTFGDIFWSGAAKNPVLEIPMNEGGYDGVDVKTLQGGPETSGIGDANGGRGTGSEIFPRDLATRRGSSAAGSVPQTVVLGPTAVSESAAGESLSASSSAPPFPPLGAGVLPAKVDINTAGHEELQKITGVGPVIAQNIIDYRNKNGQFRAVDDIKNVSGIGEAKFEKMKDEIAVGTIAPLAVSPAATSGASAAATAAVSYAVSVSMQGDGAGKVASNPAGVNCGFDCIEDFSAGVRVVLTATPEANSSFGGWTGACTGANECVLIVNSRLATVATFKVTAPAQSVPPAQVADNAVASGKILISEVMAAAEGNANYEFVELYNPTSAAIDLTGWSIKKRASTGSESNLLVASRLSGKIIGAGRHFLAVNEGGYNGAVSPDVTWATSNTLAHTAANAVLLYDASGNKIDEVAWAEIPAGQSYERQPLTVSGQFAPQPNPNPQNSAL